MLVVGTMGAKMRIIGRIWTRWFRSSHPGHASARLDEGIGADVPIRSASQDRLRRVGFASRIATILSELSLDEGRVFAIRGAWGGDKSSLKNLIVEKLGERTDAADWLEFNPWQWGEADVIARALFQQIADKLGGSLSSEASKRAAALRKYGAILTGLGDPIKKAGRKSQVISILLTNSAIVALAAAINFTLPSVATIAAALVITGMAIPWIGKVLSVLGRDRWSAPLDQIRLSLEKSLRKSGKPLVVFVDDIDRLEPDQIRFLFRQIKVNANLPNIIFVLLFQTSIVEAALKPISEGQGREFLEKIVQANFDLPAIPISMVHGVTTEELARIAGAHATMENGFSQVRWGNALVGCILPFIKNLRDARRFLSSVAIHLPLHVGFRVFEVNIIDFLCLEALRVFEPKFHADLFGERDLLLQTYRFSGDRLSDEHRARTEALIASVVEGHQEAVRAVLKELFPRISWALGGSHYGDDWNAKWIGEKRVCTARFFPRYFELQTPEGELSESDFADILAASGDADHLKAGIEHLRERDLIRSLAARFDDSVDRLPVENASFLLPAMFDIAQSLIGSRATDPFNSPWVFAWRAISWYIHRLPETDRSSLVLQAFRQTGALSVAAILIHLNSPAEQKDGSQREPSLDEEAVQAIKNEWLEQLSRISVASGQPLLAHPDLTSLLYRWRDYTGSVEAPISWVSDVIQSDSGFVALVARLMSSGTTQSIEDRVASHIEFFDRQTISDFIGIDEARRRLDNINKAQFSSEQARVLEILDAHIRKWATDTSAEEPNKP